MSALSSPLLFDPAPVGSREDVVRINATPVEARIRVTSTYDLVRDAGSRWPDARALTFLPRGLASDRPSALRFAEVALRVTQVSNLFARLGVGRGDGVALLLPNMPEAYVALWAASTAGVACPINPLLSPNHIVEIMRAASVRLIVTVGPEINAELFEGCAAAAAALGLPLATVAGGTSGGAVDVEAARQDGPDDRLTFPPPILTDVASIFHTGGTTARPKLVAHTQFNQLVCAIQTVSGSDLAEGDVLLSALPNNHVIAGIATGLATLACGVEMLIPGLYGFRNPYLLQDFWKIVEAHRVSSFSAVPTILTALMTVPLDADLACLKSVACGAAPMPAPLIAAFEAKTGAAVIESYGMTEATTFVASNPRAGERATGSVGLLAPYVEGRIKDPDAAGRGELQIRGPAVVAGYVGESPIADAEGWFDTGDLGWFDPSGRLFLDGRIKDLIIRSGHNIDPRLIEEALYAHPDVALAAAVGRPDAYAGEVPMAFVTLKDGTSASEADLRGFAREAVSERPAAPVEVVILDAMPVTALGKIFKPALRAMAGARVLDAELSPMVAALGGTIRIKPGDPTNPARIRLGGVAEDARAGLAERITQTSAAIRTPVTIDWAAAAPQPELP
ncbi:MAG: AMP-binding protein [Caulobacteraceae bacterium]|nr:AMP-binding protein [Caulobacteraceae bacterium]